MNARQLLASAIHFLVVIFVFSVGIFFLFLPKSHHLRDYLYQTLAVEPQRFAWVGLICLAVACMLFAALFSTHRGSYYKVKMDGHDLSIDMHLVKQYAQKYWEKIFPGHDVSVTVSLCPKKRLLQFTAEVPADAGDKLEAIEREFGDILRQYLGYDQPFLVTLLIK